MDAVLMIDGGFLKKKFKQYAHRHMEASDLETIAEKLISKAFAKTHDNVSYRVYYYDCPPFGGSVSVPLSGEPYDFGSRPGFEKLMSFINKVKLLPYFAVREGVLSFEGWSLKPKAYASKTGAISVNPEDFKVSLKQKGVDTKIGLDIAWVSYERISPNILLVTGDSDFTPAVKTARRNGIFVTLYSLHHGIKANLKENVDVFIDDDLVSLLGPPNDNGIADSIRTNSKKVMVKRKIQKKKTS